MNKVSITVVAALLFIFPLTILAQKEMRLYPGVIPNSKAVDNEQQQVANELVDSLTSRVSVPTLTIYQPEKGNGTAVIICPGGGYHVLLTKREGSDVARAFNKLGVTAFVLKYRLPDDKLMTDKSSGPLQDAQQAILMVKENARLWNIDPGKVGIMGFSAGGHLASTAGTHFKKPVIPAKDKKNIKPDFMLLINPVISFSDSIGHIGSRNNLLGEKPSPEKIKLYSNELQINKDTPPAFLVHSGADEVVSVANSLEFYKTLQKNKVTAGLHIYAVGEHGFLSAPSFKEWFERCTYWMNAMNLL
jgi:acetyl esterase/lipase